MKEQKTYDRLPPHKVATFKTSLLKIINKNPGLYTSELARRIRLNNRRTGKMLGTLTRHNRIIRTGRPGSYQFFPLFKNEEITSTEPKIDEEFIETLEPAPKQLHYIVFVENGDCTIFTSEDEADEWAGELLEENSGKRVYIGKIIGVYHPITTYKKELY